MYVVWKVINKYKFKLFIKAGHLLALILVQSCASYIEDNFWTSAIRWIIVECALSYPCKRTLSIRWVVYHRCSGVPNTLLGRTVLEPVAKLVPDNFEGSGGTVTPSSDFTQPEPFGTDSANFSNQASDVCNAYYYVRNCSILFAGRTCIRI